MLLAYCVFSAAALAAGFTPDDFTAVNSAASPRVAWAVRGEGSSLVFGFEVEPWPGGPAPKVEAGVAAAKKSIGQPKLVAQDKATGVARYELSVPAAALVTGQADWAKLRFAFAVSWPGDLAGADRQRERFFHNSPRAIHAGLSPEDAEWQPLDLRQHFSDIADRKNTISLSFTQPLDGKASVVIEDAAGQRIRNLVSGQPFAKGVQTLTWDGLNDRGSVVPPGEYRWRSISHPGVRPEYLFSFCNDGAPPWRDGSGQDSWGPDHSPITAACAGEKWSFFAGSVGEAGYAIVALDEAGRKQMHYNPPLGTGLSAVQLAADAGTLYAAHDGLGWGEKVDRKKPDWKATQKLTLCRFEIGSGKVLDYPGGNKFVVVATTEVGPGSRDKRPEEPALAGLALAGGKLYLAHRATQSILAVNPATGEKSGEFPLPSPGPLATNGSELFASSANKLVRIDSANGTAKPLPASVTFGNITGLAVDQTGRFFVADGATNVVQVIGTDGKLVKTIGQPRPQAAYAGPWHSDWLVNPRSLAVAKNGWLWITEQRWNPKRLTAWETSSWQLVKEKFGATSYAAPGGGFDAADPTIAVGQNTLWRLDYAARTATPLSVLEPESDTSPMLHHSFLHLGGGTILVSFGKITRLAELADGKLRPLAAISSCHQFSYAYQWKPPQAFVTAFEKAVPVKKYENTVDRHTQSQLGVMWVDKNGDGELQADEFNFSTDAEAMAGSGWGLDLHDLTIRALATQKSRRVLATLAPEGAWRPGGLLRYPTLNGALARAVPVDVDSSHVETTIDRFGNLLCNAEPEMKCFAPNGKLRWTYPNQWVGVHHSHEAPLPEIGVLQGALFYLGCAPLDQASDVFVVNGNHGRFFALTTDGMYLDEFFRDVRMGGAIDPYLIGGECFGGHFIRSEKDGAYYLQSGQTDYRLFRLHGLDQVQRGAGTLRVTAPQIAAATKAYERRSTKTVSAREAVIPWMKTPPTIDAQEADWQGIPSIDWTKNGRFPVRAWVGIDSRNLYLFYQVSDASPWLNTGKDVTLLFKTGDSIDLQLGTDPAADPKRTGAVPGDLRLLIAPFQGKPTAVLYRHRLKKADGAKPVNFTSPWRTEKVDDVRVLADARIAERSDPAFYRVEAAIPLTSLGLNAPAGKTLRADFGVLYGDDAGTSTQLRSYWSNQATNLVNDVPGEIMLSPNQWGTVKIEEAQP